MRKITKIVCFMLPFLVACGLALHLTRAAILADDQGTLCQSQATLWDAPAQKANPYAYNTYVRQHGVFIDYVEEKHTGLTVYEERDGHHIHDAIWEHAGEPCKPTLQVYRVFFGHYFNVIFLPFYMLFILSLIARRRTP